MSLDIRLGLLDCFESTDPPLRALSFFSHLLLLSLHGFLELLVVLALLILFRLPNHLRFLGVLVLSSLLSPLITLGTFRHYYGGGPRASGKQVSVFVVGKHFYGSKLTKCR